MNTEKEKRTDKAALFDIVVERMKPYLDNPDVKEDIDEQWDKMEECLMYIDFLVSHKRKVKKETVRRAVGEVANMCVLVSCAFFDKPYDVMKSMSDTYRKKNHDYGDSFRQTVERYGYVSCLTRLHDKLSRLKNKDYLVDETTEDTAKDIIGYLVMTIMEMVVLYMNSEKKEQK